MNGLIKIISWVLVLLGLGQCSYIIYNGWPFGGTNRFENAFNSIDGVISVYGFLIGALQLISFKKVYKKAIEAVRSKTYLVELISLEGLIPETQNYLRDYSLDNTKKNYLLLIIRNLRGTVSKIDFLCNCNEVKGRDLNTILDQALNKLKLKELIKKEDRLISKFENVKEFLYNEMENVEREYSLAPANCRLSISKINNKLEECLGLIIKLKNSTIIN